MTIPKKRNIFEKRLNAKPYEYPELLKYKDAITHAFWLWSEYNYTGDIQDFKINLTDKERSVIKKSMLAISQIEVTVKRFWSDLYHYFPKPEIDLVGTTFGESECHVAGTEVLTPNGWLDFRALKEGDLVMQYNLNGSLNFAPATHIVNRYHSGPVHRFFKNTWEMVVTDGHRIPYYSRTGNLLEQEAKDFIPGRDKRMPAGGYALGSVYSLSPFERLLIAIQADGYIRKWRNASGEDLLRGSSSNTVTYGINLKKQRKIDRLFWILSMLPEINYRVYDNQPKPGYKKFEIDIPVYTNAKSFDWVNLADKSYLWAQQFVDEVVEWDGYKVGYGDRAIQYFTTNKSCADKVQAVGILAGYYCPMYHRVDNRSERFNDTYTVNFTKNRLTVAGGNADQKQTYWYEGTVHCCSVPSTYLLTRYNNRTSISGNCRHFETYSKLLELLGLNDEFDNIDKIHQLMARVNYMESFMNNKDKNKGSFVLSLILFSLFIEHISLYSQFLTIQCFNKYRNYFKGISNAISASFLDEDTHGNFGIALFNILKSEHSELFTDELYANIKTLSEDAFTAEMDIVDWIFEDGDLDFINRGIVKNYIKYRYNKSFKAIGLEPIHVVDQDMLDEVKWFEVEQTSTKETDFFSKRSTDYSKKSKSITADDLF